MPEFQFAEITNIQEALNLRQFASITQWNRLEGRPRAVDFSRALRAEVRDALWMLSRQWQMGEFQGDDAGSPALAKIHLETSRFTRYQADDAPPLPFDENTPLEATVEQRPLPFNTGAQIISLDLRLLMGRHWLKLLDKEGFAGLAGEFIAAPAYSIALPDPSNPADAAVCAHAEVMAQFAAVAGRSMDGAKLYFYLKDTAGSHPYDGLPSAGALTPAQQNSLDSQGTKFIQWFQRLYAQPGEPDSDAWKPDYLEYQFAVSAPQGDGEKVFVADEYYHGHLDWYNLDVDAGQKQLGEPGDDVAVEEGEGEDPQGTITQTFLPAPVTFDGMPNTRWWAFEDRRTNFGAVQPDTIDLARLLLMEFALVYANDWFLLPVRLPSGSTARIAGLAVTNVFGERFWIEAASQGGDEDWQRWSMFTVNIQGHADVPADTGLVLLPTVNKIQEGENSEETALIRDEVANMVWGIELKIPAPDGSRKPGQEAAYETRRYYENRLAARIAAGEIAPRVPAEPKANLRYQVMNTVPENWIPFIAVRPEGEARQIQLQRAAMPRLLEGDPDDPQKVRPRSVLLREGLDAGLPYYVNEEEVPRAGIRISQSYQRTRWYNGRVINWLGVRKQTGRGEGSSGLVFDRALPVKKVEI